MAALLVRSVMASVVDPLLHLESPLGEAPGLLVPAGDPAKRQAQCRGALTSLGPPLLSLQPSQGFKTKGVIKKRCKDCYMVKRRGRWFVYCKTNPRHKQRQM